MKRVNSILMALVIMTTVKLVAIPIPGVAEEIDGMLDSAPFDRAIWGVLIEEEDGRVIYERNAGRLFVPASVRKLFSMAWIGSCHSMGKTISTGFEIRGEWNGGSLEGDIVVRGHGDPSLGGRYWEDRDAVFAPLIDGLRGRGITAIRGSVVSDVSAFDRETLQGGWKIQNIGGYWAAPVDALGFNENVVGIQVDNDCESPSIASDPVVEIEHLALRCGERALDIHVDDENRLIVASRPADDEDEGDDSALVAISNPGLFFAKAATEALERHGIRVGGPPKLETRDSEPGDTIAVVESPPLATLIGTTLEDSVNLFAEHLFKGQAGEADDEATYESAERLERMFLVNEAGVSGDTFSFTDGSGLSVEDLVAPEGVMALLRYLSQSPRREVFESLLASPGVGTLRRRLGDLAGRLHAKTGTINGVAALAGWVRTGEGKSRRFVVIVNHHSGSSGSAREIIDRVVATIAQ